MRLGLILLSVTAVVAASNKDPKNDRVDASCSNSDAIKHTYWVNAEYATCLKSNLPCDCVGDAEWLFADVDPTSPIESRFLHKTNDFMIVEAKPVKTNGRVEYHQEESKPGFSYRFEDGVLLTKVENTTYKFQRVIDYDGLREISQALGAFNFNSLKKKCDEKQFDIFKNLKIDNRAVFLCNPYLNSRNMIFIHGQCSSKWFVKKDMEALLIFKMKNPCADKTNPPSIEEELLFEIR
jgi:hypothetical protein